MAEESKEEKLAKLKKLKELRDMKAQKQSPVGMGEAFAMGAREKIERAPAILAARGQQLAAVPMAAAQAIGEGSLEPFKRIPSFDEVMSSAQEAAVPGTPSDFVANYLPSVTPRQEQAMEERPYTSMAGDILPELLFPVERGVQAAQTGLRNVQNTRRAQKEAKRGQKFTISSPVEAERGAERMIRGVTAGLIGTQLQYGDPTGTELALAGGAGGVVGAVQDFAGSRAAGRFVPQSEGGIRRMAIRDIQETSGKTPEETIAILNKWEDATKNDIFLTSGELQGNKALRDSESAVFAALPSDAKGAIQNYIEKRRLAIDGYVKRLVSNLEITDAEKARMATVYDELGDVAVDKGDFLSLMKRPPFQRFLTDLQKRPAVMEELSAFQPNSVAALDIMKKELDDQISKLSSGANANTNTGRAELKQLKQLKKDIVNMADKASIKAGKLDTYEQARKWSQREIIARDIEETLATKARENVGGEVIERMSSLRTVFQRRGIKKLQDAVDTIKDAGVRRESEKNLQLIERILDGTTDGHLQGVLGLGDQAPHLRGIYSTTGNVVLDFLSGRHRRAIAEILINPEAHKQALLEIMKQPPPNRLLALSRYGTQVLIREKEQDSDIPIR